MNYSYKHTIRKQKELVSHQNKETTRLLFSIFKFLLYTVVLCSITCGCLVLGMIRGLILSAPDIDNVSILPSQYSTNVYDANGKKITKLVTSGSNRIKVSIDQVPEHLQWAFIDIEDERFYEHNGIDVQGIGRAVWSVIKDHDMQGASTITQQLLKNNVFTDWTEESSYGSSIKRKVQEQYLAVKFEKTTNKKAILETYLNTINLGANTLGVQAASQRYFNKDVSKLTVSESAVIASITQNPSKYNPITNPEENAKRRMSCLKYMLKNGHITEEQFQKAVKDKVYERIQKVDAKITQNKDSEIYSYFVDEVVNQVLDDLQEQKGYTYTQAYNALYGGGLKVYSTLDPEIQTICDEEISNDANFPSVIYWSINWAFTVQHPDGSTDNYSESYISYYHKTILQENAFKLIFSSQEDAEQCVKDYKQYLRSEGLLKKKDKVYETLYFTPQPQVSFTVMDQRTGYVKAIVGGRGSKKVSLSLDRATQSTRQPGSTFKILSTYAPAIDTRGYTLNTTIVDAPYWYDNGKPVQNWNKTYLGAVTVKKAIAQSMNVCAVKTLTDIGVQLGYDYLLNFGITTLVDNRVDENGATMTDIQQALALGGITDGVTNLEMTGAYAAIANDGVYTRPVFYSQVVDEDGRVILDNTQPTTHTVLKQNTAALLTEAMKSVITEGTGRSCKLKTNMPVAGKTGTTSNSYDLWFCGYTPYLTASIWTGFDENKQLAFSQVYHELLWAKIMNRINETKGYEDKDFDYTEKLQKIKICTSSKKVATSYCPHITEEYFPKGSEPTDSCNIHAASAGSSNNGSSSEETTTKKKTNSDND
ncbi:MAG: PBP1A family penicillin-binding protein [Lachnospiraceae bacterium]|nr:PBP1A family penicillin-binding protein [Lachnospiraceae bacterium]